MFNACQIFFQTWNSILIAPFNKYLMQYVWAQSFFEWLGDYMFVFLIFLLFILFILNSSIARNKTQLLLLKLIKFTKLHTKLLLRRYLFNLKCLKEDLLIIITKVLK